MAPTLQSLGIDKFSIEDRICLVQEIWDSIALEVEQGNRMLILGKTGDKLLEGGLVPTAALAFAANARFEGCVSLQNVEC